MTVHVLVAARLIVISAIPCIIISAINDTGVHGCVVGIFISCSDSQEVANGMSKAQSELPRSIELEVVSLTIVRCSISISHICIVGSGKVVPCWCSHRHAYTERAVLHRTEDDAGLYIETSTGNLAVVNNGQLADIVNVGRELLAVLAVALIVDIMYADSESKIHTVIYIAANIEVILSDIASRGLVEVVGRRLIVAVVVAVFYEVVII